MRKQSEEAKILDDFAHDWEERVGSKYFINWGKEVKFAQDLIAMSLTPDEYTARKKAYFAEARWWEYGKWGFATFVNNINKLVTLQPKKVIHIKARVIMIACAECGAEHKATEVCPKCEPISTPWSNL